MLEHSEDAEFPDTPHPTPPCMVSTRAETSGGAAHNALPAHVPLQAQLGVRALGGAAGWWECRHPRDPTHARALQGGKWQLTLVLTLAEMCGVLTDGVGSACLAQDWSLCLDLPPAPPPSLS